MPFSKVQDLSPNSNKKLQLVTTMGVNSRTSVESKRPLKQLAFKRRNDQLKPKSPAVIKRSEKGATDHNNKKKGLVISTS